jgi:hypothetical protein
LGARQDTHSSPGRVRRSIPVRSPRRSPTPHLVKRVAPSGQRIDAEISRRSRGGNSAGQLIENNREAHWPRAALIVRAEHEARVGGGRRARWLLLIDRGVLGCAGPGLRNREHEFGIPDASRATVQAFRVIPSRENAAFSDLRFAELRQADMRAAPHTFVDCAHDGSAMVLEELPYALRIHRRHVEIRGMMHMHRAGDAAV